MSDSSVSVAVSQPPSPLASSQLASFLGIEKGMMIDTIKSQCFKSLKPGEEVTDAQLATFISIANVLRLNPLVPGMMYAYPDRQGGGITPIIGPDGVFKLLSSHPDIDSWEIQTFPEDQGVAPTHATCKIFRKGVERPVIYTAVYSEWKVQSNPNWVTRPRHMLGIRALKQAARQLIHGLPFDEDERKIAETIDVTHSAPAEQPQRDAAPPKSGAAAAVDQAKRGPGRPKKDQGAVIDVPATESKPEDKPLEGKDKIFVDTAVRIANEVPPRTTLKADEKLTTVVNVTEFKLEMVKTGGKEHPSVIAEVEGGGFKGKVYHLGGATVEGNALVPNPAWQLEKPVEVQLIGRARKDPAQPCFVFVESIKLHEPVAQTAAPAARTGETLE